MSKRKGTRRYDVLAALRQNPRASLRELCVAIGISEKSVATPFYHLNELEAEGLIRRLPGVRNIQIIDDPDPSYVRRAASKKQKTKKEHNANLARKRSVTADPQLQERIDAVVAKAQAREAQHQRDVMDISADPLLIMGSLGACKLG